jgi:hypothetical protein
LAGKQLFFWEVCKLMSMIELWLLYGTYAGASVLQAEKLQLTDFAAQPELIVAASKLSLSCLPCIPVCACRP